MDRRAGRWIIDNKLKSIAAIKLKKATTKALYQYKLSISVEISNLYAYLYNVCWWLLTHAQLQIKSKLLNNKLVYTTFTNFEDRMLM